MGDDRADLLPMNGASDWARVCDFLRDLSLTVPRAGGVAIGDFITSTAGVGEIGCMEGSSGRSEFSSRNRAPWKEFRLEESFLMEESLRSRSDRCWEVVFARTRLAMSLEPGLE